MRAARSASTQSAGALTRKGKRQASEEKEDGKHQWCLFHNLTAHSDVNGRIQHHNKTDGGSANYSTHSRYSAVLSTRKHPPGCNPERPCISINVVEALTDEEAFWPFDPTDEPAASFGHSASGDAPTDTSELFGNFGGVTGEETVSAAFTVEERPVRGWGFRGHITGGLASMMSVLQQWWP